MKKRIKSTESNRLKKYRVYWTGEIGGYQEVMARSEAEAEAEFDDGFGMTVDHNHYSNEVTSEFYPLVDRVQRANVAAIKRKKSKKKKR